MIFVIPPVIFAFLYADGRFVVRVFYGWNACASKTDYERTLASVDPVMTMASLGHSSAHIPQPLQYSKSISNGKSREITPSGQ
jgi:hypothetical protein